MVCESKIRNIMVKNQLSHVNLFILMRCSSPNFLLTRSQIIRSE